MPIDPAELMNLRDGDPGEAPPPLIAYPSWMDARYMLAASKASEPRTLTFDANALATIPANGQRWGLLVWNGSVGPTFGLTPFADALAWPLLVLTGVNQLARITLFDWGQLVSYPWQCGGIQGASFRYSELITY